jgi:hypothetical protein
VAEALHYGLRTGLNPLVPGGLPRERIEVSVCAAARKAANVLAMARAVEDRRVSSELGMMQGYDREAPSEERLEGLIAEVDGRELAEVRERCLRLRLHFDAEAIAALLVRDLPFLFTEVEYLRAVAELKDQTIFTLRDEHTSLDLASRALQTAIQQQRSQLASLQAQLEQASVYEVQATRALTVAVGAIEVAQRRDTLRIYADARELIHTVLYHAPGEVEADESERQDGPAPAVSME